MDDLCHGCNKRAVVREVGILWPQMLCEDCIGGGRPTTTAIVAELECLRAENARLRFALEQITGDVTSDGKSYGSTHCDIGACQRTAAAALAKDAKCNELEYLKARLEAAERVCDALHEVYFIAGSTAHPDWTLSVADMNILDDATVAHRRIKEARP